MKKALVISNVVFISLTLLLAYVLVFTGTEMIETPNDTRVTVKYEPDLKKLVLSEMRDYLEVMGEIQLGLATNDPDRIYRAASTQGQAAIDDTPIRLLKLSPVACKTMGFAGHDLFQAIADSARLNFKPETTIKQMSELTNNCIVCHQTYKME